MSRVSYVVPSRSPSAHMDDAVNSLLAQDFEDIQIIVVWDTAEDVTTQSWEADDRVLVVRTGAHVGTPRALNMGIGAANGDLIARLDADDLAEPDRTTRQAAFLQANPAVVAVGALARLIDDKDAALGVLDGGSGDVRQLLTRRNPVVHSSLMTRASVLREIGAYDEQCLRMQDYELLCRLGQAGEVHVLPEVLISYRIHPQQSSRVTSPYAPYTRRVLRSRYALARSLGAGRAQIAAQAGLWWGAQVLRHAGVRPPGHRRRSAPGAV